MHTSNSSASHTAAAMQSAAAHHSEAVCIEPLLLRHLSLHVCWLRLRCRRRRLFCGRAWCMCTAVVILSVAGLKAATACLSAPQKTAARTDQLHPQAQHASDTCGGHMLQLPLHLHQGHAHLQ